MLKDLPTNEDVIDRMLAEIWKAQIVIADFTGGKSNVYFEAGFALALKRPVYWTCSADEIGDVHFNVDHFQHIAWKNPDDLRERLRDKILALSGYGRARAQAHP